MFLFGVHIYLFIFSSQSKDILQEQIDKLQSESSVVVAELEDLKNKNAEMMEVSL